MQLWVSSLPRAALLKYSAILFFHINLFLICNRGAAIAGLVFGIIGLIVAAVGSIVDGLASVAVNQLTQCVNGGTGNIVLHD